MKYTNKEKSFVQLNNTTVPRGHRLWNELGIDEAEKAGRIEEYKEPTDTALDKIAKLESQITPRRLREALAGDTAFIDDIEKQISKLRKEL